MLYTVDMIRLIFAAISIMLLCESVVLVLTTKINIGLAFVYLLTLISILYTLFFDTINDFCSGGIGRVFAILFCSGMVIYLLLFTIVALLNGPPVTGEEKAVIILGAGLNKEEVSETLRHRLDGAIDFYNKHDGVTLCVTGFKGRFDIIPEAVAMQRYLINNGIPQTDILVDPNSPDTYTNIENAMQLFNENDINVDNGVVVVTNRFHCYRAVSYAKKQGIENVTAIPTSIPISMVHSAYSREVFALIKLWLFER